MTEPTNLPHLLTRVFDTPLLIEPGKLETILRVLEPKITGGHLAVPDQEVRTRRPYQTLNGVAVIPVVGTLVHRAGGMDAMSGMTSYQQIESMIATALNDQAVQGILLDMDSPGGEAAGAFDLADKIYAARSKKPVWAYVNEMAASAGYAIASAAEKVVMTRTAIAGSIGVVSTHLDASGFDREKGLKYTYIYAGARKVDGNPHEPLSDEARAGFQAMVDGIYDVFTETVARHRGMSAKSVRATEAAMYMGQDAVTAGLADEIGTFEGVMNALQGRATSFFTLQSKEPTMSDTDTTEGGAPENQAADQTPETPAVPAETPEAAAARGIASERARATAILEAATKLNAPAHVAQGLITSGVSLEVAKDKLIDHAAAQSVTQGFVTANSGAKAPSSDDSLPVEERAKAKWDRDPVLRAEFRGKFESYLAFARAEDEGRVKILKK